MIDRFLINTLSREMKKLVARATKIAKEGYKCLADAAGIVNQA